MSLAPGLLVAAPALGDPNFERTVVLLAEHDSQQAFGWVINGVALMSISELLERAEVERSAKDNPRGVVRVGGPVGTRRVWLLYRTQNRPPDIEDQLDIGGGITVCSSRRLLEEVAAGRAPDPLVGVAGCAAWGASQLEDEVRSGAWLPTDPDSALVFDSKPEDTWLRAYERAGTSAIAFTSRVIGSA